ncbi:hypothetical protein M413DRAFT_198074 [Hebeloma cylindrosporum]|uniref:Uncharacterized protein n=1 Tax=Hebeloma cylindrosporum TaxID=76867 RepID=A0A0C3C532_HEBCY|nr:hypothetical protein M413DRAFT_198074 [Hebeloma cylindrosporum h7]
MLRFDLSCFQFLFLTYNRLPQQLSIAPFPNLPPSNKIPMPELADLSDLSLHSPSSQIVGTPFATDSTTKFEYPFPDAPASSSGSLPPQQFSGVVSPSANTLSMSIIAGNPDSPPLESCSSFPMLSTARSPSNPSSPVVSSEMPSYNPAHPKLKAIDPPIPPSLAKKRGRWSLALGSLGRRTSFSGPTSEDSASEHTPRFALDDPGNCSARSSPREEQNNKN